MSIEHELRDTVVISLWMALAVVYQSHIKYLLLLSGDTLHFAHMYPLANIHKK